MIKPVLLLALAALCTACAHRTAPTGQSAASTTAAPLRIATYNTSLYSDEAGGLVHELQGDSAHARKIAAVLQRVRPDLVLLNEFDFDPAHRAADLFQQRYLQVAQPGGGDALSYPYRYLAPVNTGVPSGLDLDNNGSVGGDGRSRGNDAWGYGLHPGQYGMLVLSRYPIDAQAVRSFQLLKWSALPGALRPVDPTTRRPFYNDAIWAQLRLSSKSHWDVPVRTPLGVVHALISHPTPPVFDGAEKRNAARNHDELQLWRAYLDNAADTTRWLCDDQGRCGGLERDAHFVILGDLNNDPIDGAGRHEAIRALINHPRVLQYPTPVSAGGPEKTAQYAAQGIAHTGDPHQVTGDFGPQAGTMRLDYVLPSGQFTLAGSGIFCPASSSPDAAIADGSDHHAVWVDVAVK
ncbi:endonuclease/exonuclease/phosphatase family protein [Xanthomonas campestris]|uniref:endonuclease/exonuclease/phosphatase family protein n=1 Tax=Xanthomonas campestris TaxID=339 RepID=UPI0021633E8F|nr:endonuclease/exonuclease/phosphatase family protein [Xanthomonas campestris]MEA9576162.1 endonuclease/exonuclease/phosphatase family protein [Xanthomonas campestris]